jgi:pimeloyl-ACP methyl ester carboxylesterase
VPPPVRYAQSGDLSIAYQVVGERPPDLIWCIGSYSHLDILWESPLFARTFQRLGEIGRLILFDKRGMGLSDRTDKLYTLEERIDDVRAVLDAARSSRSYLMGFSEGGAMAALFAATYPDRAAGLILYGAPVRYAWAPDWPHGATEEEFEERWRGYRESGFVDDYTTPYWRRWLGPALAGDQSFLEWWTRLRRAMGTPAARHAQGQMNRLIDVRSILPSIHAPALVMVREEDPVCPLDEAKYAAQRIPNARLVVLPGSGHLMPDVWEEWIAAVEEFITGAPRAIPTQRFLTTLVAADIVGSTDLIARVGDAQWRDLLTRHYELVGRRLAMYSGVEVDRAGDGFLARFDGPARAVRFAREIDREDRSIGLRARAAVHTGEVEVSDGAVRGMAVHIAARLTGLAHEGEVIVSSTVRDLVGGSGFSFVDRGVHSLKGVPEPKQVFALA